MAKVGVSLKIDVSKIEKDRLFKGAKGTYLDATVFIDLADLDQYGNSGMITQDVSKDEKDQGVKGAILGNCKVFWRDDNSQPAPQRQAAQQDYRGHSGSNQANPTSAPAGNFDDFDDDK